MFPANHKTVFVLDHTPYFGISSENPIDFDLLKSRGPGYIPLAPICKSLWTCSVEAAVEYCRIVWDLFPDGKLIRFVVSDAAAHILNTWNSIQQNLTHILNGLCMVGPVRRGAGGDVVGLRAAVEALAECSSTQATRQAADRHTTNRGRIICITSARDNNSLRSLADIALNALQQQNKRIAGGHAPPTPEAGAPPTPPLMQVHYCHLVIINVTPENTETLVHNQPLYEIGGGVIGVEVHCTTAGQLAILLGKLVLPHYNLATTTVTGIPMKEEQNASSSANYDVEIIHSIDAHAGLRAAAAPSEQNDTVTLRWSTPRGAEAGTVSGTLWRVTPVDVASRPSACLVNFLLNGRSVTLEMPRKTGGRSASHVLSAQGGEIWVGALGGRQTHDDPPALSDGPGGRVTDYRIKDLGALMQQNRLWSGRGAGGGTRARARLQRHTAYWPLTISSTLLFNLLPMVEPLIRLVVQETLTEDEVAQCRAVLCALLALEARHDSPVSHVAPALRSKWSGSRREELWRQVWREAEALVRAHAASPTHRLLLRALLECRTHGADATNGAAAGTDASRASVIRATTDSPLSPTAVGPSGDLWTCGGPLGAFMNAPKTIRRPDFAGRMAAGSRPAVLYPNFNSKKQEVETAPTH